MNALTKTESIALTSVADKATLMSALRSSLYPGAQDASIEMVLAYCQAGGYDPMTKPVHIVPMWDRNAKTMRDTVMPGIGLYRIIADRSGKYAGQDDADFGPDMEGWGMRFPQWCKVTVWKVTAAGRVAYSAKVFWLESYSTAGKDSDAPNAMWKKRPYGQLEKCAEAAALRKAFPEIGSQPTVEEMAGKEDHAPAIEIAPPVTPPTPALSRVEQAKQKLIAANSASPVVHELPAHDPETGEILPASETEDPIADLILSISECQTHQELEIHRAAVAGLKNGLKSRAIDAWKAVEARLPKAA